MCDASGEFFTFQQDSALAYLHTGHKTLYDFSFIPPDLWPPNSPDLNPVESSSSESISRRCTTLMNRSDVCHMFGRALTRPSLKIQLASGVGVSHMYAGKRRTLLATIVTIFSHMIRNVSVFVKCELIFLDIFCKLPQIRTSNFCKVLRQQNEGP